MTSHFKIFSPEFPPSPRLFEPPPTIKRKRVPSVCSNQPPKDLGLSSENIKSHLLSIKPFKSRGLTFPLGTVPRPSRVTSQNIKRNPSPNLQASSVIYTKVLQISTLPQILKDANILSTFKKGDRKLAKNYRPISLTSKYLRK